MKKLIAATFALAATTCTYATENAEYTRGNHRIFIEPDISIDFMGKVENDYGTWKSNGQQYGVKIGYEFYKPNDIYAELATFHSLGNVQRMFRDKEGEKFEYEGNTSRSNTAGHLGYALQIDDFSFAPFSGFGRCSWKDGDFELNLAYLPIGIKAQYPLSKNVNIGLKCERLQYFHFWHITPDSKESGNILADNECGYEISMPFSFVNAIAQDGWYASIEPYFLKLHDDLSVAGGRFAASREF